MVNPRKAYPVDHGLIPVFDRSGRANVGHALETTVRIELERRGAEVSYVRTDRGFEVDFIARYPGNRQELIQVCANLDDPAPHEREIRALIEAAKEFPKAALHLLILEPLRAGEMPQGITVHSAAAWLLGEQKRVGHLGSGLAS
jgi:predicted AAA+ superfamily ATPase